MRKNAATAQLAVNEIPPILRHRLLSLRDYDHAAMMVFSTVTEGKDLAEMLTKLFENQMIVYVHVHKGSPLFQLRGATGGLVMN